MTKDIVYISLVGISAITFIYTIGSVVSRNFNFNYSWLAIFSFSVYIIIGYWGSKLLGPHTAISIALAIGIYDATVGFWISIKLKAKMGISSEERKELLGIYSIVIMMITSVILSIIGYALTYI